VTDEVKGVVEDTSEFKTSNDRQMYAVTVNGEDYSDFGHVPDELDKGQPVRIEYTVSGQYNNIEEIEAISQDELRAEAAGDADPRIAASQVVGQIWSEKAEEMAKIYRMTEHFAEYQMTGQFPDDVEAAIEATSGEEVPDDLKKKLEELSNRLGSIEQKDLADCDYVEDVDAKVSHRVDELQEQVEQLQATIQSVADDEGNDEKKSKAEKNAEAMAEDAPEPDDDNEDVILDGSEDSDEDEQDTLFGGDDEEETDEEG